MIDISRMPESAICSVRGIGVAVSVSTCTSARSAFSASLCLTPKCCSSSTMTRPRSLNWTGLAKHRVGADDDLDLALRRDLAGLAPPPAPGPGARAARYRTGQPWKRSVKVLKCWRASSVVGRPPRPAGRSSPPRRRRAARPRSCRNRRRRRSAGPSAGRSRGRRARRRSRRAGRRSPRRGSGRRIRRTGRRAGRSPASALQRSRAAAMAIRPSAISRSRSLARALRACQAAPPSRSSCTPSPSEP